VTTRIDREARVEASRERRIYISRDRRPTGAREAISSGGESGSETMRRVLGSKADPRSRSRCLGRMQGGRRYRVASRARGRRGRDRKEEGRALE
jgi:hypothetical protein